MYIVYRSASPGVDSLSGNSKDGGLFMFQCAAWFVFLISVGCQVIGQVALNESPSPGLFVVNVVGLCIFPIYLDGEYGGCFFLSSLPELYGEYVPLI